MRLACARAAHREAIVAQLDVSPAAVDEEQVSRLDVAVRHRHAMEVRHGSVGLHGDAMHTARMNGAQEASPSRPT